MFVFSLADGTQTVQLCVLGCILITAGKLTNITQIHVLRYPVSSWVPSCLWPSRCMWHTTGSLANCKAYGCFTELHLSPMCLSSTYLLNKHQPSSTFTMLFGGWECWRFHCFSRVIRSDNRTCQEQKGRANGTEGPIFSHLCLLASFWKCLSALTSLSLHAQNIPRLIALRICVMCIKIPIQTMP